MDPNDPTRAQVLARLAKVEAAVRNLEAAFPDSDPDGHRRYHEDLKQAAADWRKLRQELIAHLVKGGTWAALGWVLFSLWEQFLSKVRG